MQQIKWLLISLIAIVFLAGVGKEHTVVQADPQIPEVVTDKRFHTGYEAPELKTSVFNADGAEGNEMVKLDVSSLSLGYIGLSATSDHRLKFQVITDQNTYTYDVASDGTPSIFPLQSGNGKYEFRLMENVSGTKYAVAYDTYFDVELDDEFAPFLTSSDYVNYDKDSDCVKKAEELASGAADEVELLTGVYDYICSTVTYDYDKAANVQSGYLPDVDDTMHTGKGICFDYASLAAAMLRSQGIPAKMVFGYVSPDGLYHAWNMFYSRKDGWVTADFRINPDDWTRMDLTFSAGGEDASFIGDGNNYTDLYYY